MNFGLKKKFALLAILAGALISFVSLIGYYTANQNLSATLEKEIKAVVDAQEKELDGWLQTKAASAEYAANLLTNLNGDFVKMKDRNLMSLTTSDKDILEVTVGLNDGYFASYNAGDYTGQLDPTSRPWYKNSRDLDRVNFTDAYIDVYTNELIVSAAAPIKANGQFVGSTCNDISLVVLGEQIKKMKYEGEGDGIIFERSGKLLATSTDRGVETVQEIPGFAQHFDDMLKNGSGYFSLPKDDKFGSRFFAYATLPTTGWIMGIAIDEDFVFASIHSMRTTFLILSVAGLALMIVVCLQLSATITNPIAQLQRHAVELAKGNLQMENISITSKDEIGTLAQAFNDMSGNLRNLIGKMANTAHQVAASSEQLTASAQQSADTSIHVAEKVGEVNLNMKTQLEDIDAAKENVDIVFKDIENMSEKTKVVVTASNETAVAAQRGEKLMESAVNKMFSIEKSVVSSAEVVKKLGESSEQIGQIVEAISAIADQTNLLALNAAIEAARAGEQGRGFAVVSDEVRKLAAESATSAEKIRDRIAKIQQDTTFAVAAIENGTKDVQQGTDAIREVGEQFKNIMQRVDGIQQQMAGIGTSMKTVSAGANKIVAAVESINEVSRQTSEHTGSISSDTETQSASNEEIAAASQALAQLAEEMQEAIGKFKI
ncbi:MAG: methyl-accepting chemotaxis protein [Selenomonadaceae bacterium]|nr:methyl-accepting chemotaxis protein [Selenomonadaceae bacterium]